MGSDSTGSTLYVFQPSIIRPLSFYAIYLKMYPFHKQLPFTYRLNLYALFITVMGEMRLSFIDSDFLITDTKYCMGSDSTGSTLYVFQPSIIRPLSFYAI
jgi:hypothetical protein